MASEAQPETPSMVGQMWWLEVPCNRVAAFYAAALGWKYPDPEKGNSAPAPGMETAHPFNCGLLNGTFSRMVSDNDVAAVVDSVDHGRMPVLAKYLVESIDETLAKIQDAGKKVDV